MEKALTISLFVLDSLRKSTGNTVRSLAEAKPESAAEERGDEAAKACEPLLGADNGAETCKFRKTYFIVRLELENSNGVKRIPMKAEKKPAAAILSAHQKQERSRDYLAYIKFFQVSAFKLAASTLNDLEART